MSTGSSNGAEDGELLDAAARGDQRAFRLLYARYSSLVTRRILKHVPHTLDLDDLRQQVFMRLFSSLPRFRRESTFATFLSAIAKNVVFDHLRKLRRAPLMSHDVLTEEVEDNCLSPEERVDNAERMLALDSHLRRLSANHRAAVALVLMEGHPLREAARMTGANAAAVKLLVSHARRTILSTGRE